jgi:hypothetical protein
MANQKIYRGDFVDKDSMLPGDLSRLPDESFFLNKIGLGEVLKWN